MESSKELIGKITKERDMLVDVINSTIDRFTTDLEIASTMTREQFIDYCGGQTTPEDSAQLMSDIVGANPDAVDCYYAERVADDADYLSMDEVNNDYVKCDEVTSDFIKDNFGMSFLYECADEALADMCAVNKDAFVQTVMAHLDTDLARRLVFEIINDYM